MEPTQRIEQFAADPHRPRYHFLPEKNWLNDPNGLIHWNGEYHMFYQYNPAGPFHGTIHWGHAVSSDFVHWQDLPIALTPEPGTADEDGCWSGVAVNDHGVPTLIYSGNRDGNQRACLATSHDGLLTWQKDPKNPVIEAPPEDLHIVQYRDHSVWREDNTWYQLMGAGLEGQGGTALLYRSADLRQWEYVHPLLVGDAQRFRPIWSGTMWECPDFFALDGHHVLTVAVWDAGQLHYSLAMIGDYHDHHFVPKLEHKLDYGDRHYYAAQSFSDAQGRRLSFGWLHEGRNVEAQLAAGWSGVMSLPRVLGLGPSGQLRMQPVPELRALRTEHSELASFDLPSSTEFVLPELEGDTLELLVEFAPTDHGQYGLSLRRSPDGTEATRLVYDADQGQLIIDRTRSSLDLATDHNPHVAPLPLGPHESLRLHIFLDRSVLEVFANEQVTITSRIYPTRADSQGIAIFAENTPVRLLALDAWQLRSIWQNEPD